jgi:hypothetical protein
MVDTIANIATNGDLGPSTETEEVPRHQGLARLWDISRKLFLEEFSIEQASYVGFFKGRPTGLDKQAARMQPPAPCF